MDAPGRHGLGVDFLSGVHDSWAGDHPSCGNESDDHSFIFVFFTGPVDSGPYFKNEGVPEMGLGCCVHPGPAEYPVSRIGSYVPGVGYGNRAIRYLGRF